MDITIAPRTGLTLRNPVIAASGTFGYGTEFVAAKGQPDLGAIVCKGTTQKPRGGNEPMRVWETPAGMLNAIGLQNIGVEALVREKAPIWATWDIPVFVNVSGTTVEEYRAIILRLDGVAGVAGVELNISCPNVKEGGVAFGTDPRLVSQVTSAARSATDLPLIVKLSPNVTDIRVIAAAAEAAGADAISLVNTVYGMAIDSRRRTPALSSESGGLSGPAIKPLALHMVYQVAQEVAVPVIGLGGIMSASDALEYLMAGASAVQMGTALLVDPLSWREVVGGLREWCRREGVQNLEEIIGTANPGAKSRTGETRLAGSM